MVGRKWLISLEKIDDNVFIGLEIKREEGKPRGLAQIHPQPLRYDDHSSDSVPASEYQSVNGIAQRFVKKRT
jgi:hypothetical protein